MNLSSFPRNVDKRMSIKELASCLPGAFSLLGSPKIMIGSIGSPQECQADSLIFFRSQEKNELQMNATGCNAGAMVVNHPIEVHSHQSLLVTPDPLALFIKALGILFITKNSSAIDPSAQISESAQVAPTVSIGPNAVIEAGVRIDEDCSIGANCFIGESTHIDKGTVIQNNVSIGGVGLGFHFEEDGTRLFFPHLGAVRIGAHAVIGSGSVVVRGQLSDTIIGAGTRLGNLVNVGHNVQIGKNCAISSGTSFAGGASVGDDCQFGIGVCVNAKITIASQCKIGMGTVVTKSLPKAVSVFGNPAKPLPTMGNF